MVTQGAWYEKFVRDIYQGLVDQSTVGNVRVEHDARIVGRSGATHQIDVYWEFEIAGSRYRTCVECKNFTSRVKKSHVASFATILHDIGNATGIFVTTAGYQAGAKPLAKDQHIRLVLLNPAIRTIEITMNVTVPEYKNVAIEFDLEACKPLLAASGRDAFELYREDTGETLELLDPSGCKVQTLNEFIRTQPSEPGSHNVSLSGYFLESEIGLLPLLSLKYDLSVEMLRRTSIVTANHAVKAILEDVLTNETTYVHDNGSGVIIPKAT